MRTKRIGWLLVVALSYAAALSAQGGGVMPGTSVTLFNSGRVLVRRTFPVNLPRGMSTQSLPLGSFIAASVASLDPGVDVVRTTADGGVSEAALLRRNIGRTFEIYVGDRPRLHATLVSMDPERWEWTDGSVAFARPGEVLWPKELVPATRVGEVTMQSDRARQSVTLMYETSGSAWSAGYRLVLGAGGRIEGTAALSTGTLDLADAEVQLLAGDIGQAQVLRDLVPRDAVATVGASGVAMQPGVVQAAPPVNEAIGDVHVYTLPERVTFVPGVQTAVPLFDPTPARAVRRLTLSGSLPFYGGIGQQSDERAIPVGVSYRMERRLGTPFGDLALPAGIMGVFDLDKGGRVQLVGQGRISHTAPGEELNVNTGTAFDVTAMRVQTDYSTSRTGGNNQPVSTIAMASYRVTLANAKDSAVVVEVREDRGGDWSVVTSSVPPEKRSSTRAVFTVTVPAKGTAMLTYRVRVMW